MTSNRAIVVFDEAILSRKARRQLAWRLREKHHWGLERIGARLGTSKAAVCHLLRREAANRSRRSTVATRPPGARRRESVRGYSLSSVFNV